MFIKVEFDIRNFQAWSGGVCTKECIINAGKEDDFNTYVNDIFPDGCTESEMNSFLWFNNDVIFEALGLNGDGEVPIYECPVCGCEYDEQGDAEYCCNCTDIEFKDDNGNIVKGYVNSVDLDMEKVEIFVESCIVDEYFIDDYNTIDISKFKEFINK